VLRAYTGQTIRLRLPDDLTVDDIGWLAVWCDRFRHNFGHVSIPKDLDDVPPFVDGVADGDDDSIQFD